MYPGRDITLLTGFKPQLFLFCRRALSARLGSVKVRISNQPQFDARQKLRNKAASAAAAKSPPKPQKFTDARQRIGQKTKFVDARVRIENKKVW